MKADVGHVGATPHKKTEGLDTAIQVLVVDRVLVVPHSVGWGHFRTNEENAVVAGIRLVLSHRGAGTRPGHDGGLHAYGRAVR